MAHKNTLQMVLRENEELRNRLQEAEQTLQAIRNHEVDALIVEGPEGNQVFTLQGADQPYRIFVESMNEGAAIINEEGIILHCNQSLSDLLRTPLHTVIGSQFFDLVSAFDGQTQQEVFKKLHTGNFRGELMLKTPACQIPVYISERSLRLNDIQTYCLIITDISDRKKAEAELIRSEESARAGYMEIEMYYNVTPIGLCILDNDLRYVKVNNKLSQIDGLPPHEHIGKTFQEILPSIAGPAQDLANRVLETGDTFSNIEFTFDPVATQGNTRTCLTTWFPLKDAREQVARIGVMVEDITERRRLEDQLGQSQKMQAIGTLAGGIAHDFNNILAGIIGFSEMVLDDLPPDSKSAQRIHRVLKAANRGSDLVRQILAFSRRSQLTRKRVSVNDIIKETLQLLRASLPSTIDITVVTNAGQDKILATPSELQQIILNLATNSAAAMKEKGGLLSITTTNRKIRGEDETNNTELEPGEYIRVDVSDTGTGIESHLLQRIFEPFFTTKEPGEGTGMGLSVVYGIVKSLKGDIIVESTPGKGSTFSVLLPLVQEGAESSNRKTTPQLRGSERILFVDDEEILTDWGKDVLHRLGYYVTTVNDATETLELFSKDPSAFDIAVLDQTMPKMTGYILAQKLLAMRPDFPIILCTGHSDMVSPEMAKKVGIKEFVMKPLGREGLAEAVRKVLDGRG